MDIRQNWLVKSRLINQAYFFAKKAHQNQKRFNGEPYFNHVVETAKIVAGWGLDESTLAAALLHDVVEDTPHTLKTIEVKFNKDIAFLVDGVTKVSQVKYRGTIKEMENVRKFILAISKDIRVILIKLADRLHNMRTLEYLPLPKQKRVASETMEIYAPLAYRLGMFEVSGELEDLSFPCIYPKENLWLNQNLKERYQERTLYAKKIQPLIQEELLTNKIHLAKIESRGKRRTSLYRKLQRYDMNFDRIYDLVAIRCIVKSISDCYAALGIIHKKWMPVPGRIKDYIALPKPNGYRSLHTTIFGPDKKIIEVQIRTKKMHKEAERGIAAHWAYQQSKTTKNYIRHKVVPVNRNELGWIEQLRNWQQNLTDPKEFMRSLKIDFLENRILVLTPKGKVIELPRASTPVDFAYRIHSEVGNSCAGARINGKIAPLNTQLRSGDMVEILVQKNKRPSIDWLDFVKTSNARGHIRASTMRRIRKLTTTPREVEFKLLAKDSIGLLKNISGTISRSHINITGHHSQSANFKEKLVAIKVRCSLDNRSKIKKISGKLEKIKGVKSVESRLV